jgi:hypothetical protein
MAIDLEALSRDLEGAGWKQQYSGLGGVEYARDSDTRHIGVVVSLPVNGARDIVQLSDDRGGVNVLDPIWQQALELIRQHAAPAPDKVQNADVYHRAVVDVRETLEGIARMTDEERRKVASLQNQAVWIVYSLQQEGLLATPAPDRPTPSDPQAAARERAREAMADALWELPNLSGEDRVLHGQVDAILAAIAAAGLVITAPKTPAQRVERTSEALTNFYSFVNTLGAPGAPAGDQVTISRTAAEAALIWTNVVSVWDEDDQAAYDEIADALADAESGPVGERGEGKL